MTRRKPNPVPKSLRGEGRTLYVKLLEEFCIDDVAGFALARAAAEAMQRGQEARELINKEGLTVLDHRGVPKAHPGIAIEKDSRAAMISALRALKLAPGDEQ
jgi:hypothetical protein